MTRSHARRHLVLVLALSSLVVLGRATASAEVDPDSAPALGSAGPVFAVYGPNGSQDPALGFEPGSAVGEAFGGPCRATVVAWADDPRTPRWSGWLGSDPTAAGLAFYGPNGSQDPAVGFIPGC